MKRTSTRLSDGRELIYFDADESVKRDHRDERGLAPSAAASQLRYDPFRDDWVVVAAHRQSRTFKPSQADCPLCPSAAERLTEIPSPSYDVAVLENRFPALSAVSAAEPLAPTEPNLARSATGRCEVVCFTDVHDASFASLDTAKAELIVEAWADRTRELSSLDDVEQVFCFENRGHETGVTIDHPHGQIYAFPFVAPRTRRGLERAIEHRRRTGRNLAEDVVDAERKEGTRVVAENEEWIAFVPFAAHWPYEVHLYPLTRVPDLLELSPSARRHFADLYLDVMRRFSRLFDMPAPYVSAIHQAPVRLGRDELALHVEVFTSRRAPDKLKYLAGTESAMDVFSNDISPEDAAARLRALD